MLESVKKMVLLEILKKMVMLLEEKTKIINLFVSTMGIQRLEMVECVVNGGQEGIVGVADLK
jgi:hypothetical protein